MYNNNKKRKETLYLVIDHTGTSPHNDIDAQELDNIDRAKSFYGCRYHYVIKRDGEVEEGRTLDRASPLTGVLEEESMTECLIGGKDLEGEPCDNFTDAQRLSLHILITNIRTTHPAIEVLGRREIKRQRTTGPALDLTPFR